MTDPITKELWVFLRGLADEDSSESVRCTAVAHLFQMWNVMREAEERREALKRLSATQVQNAAAQIRGITAVQPT